MTNAQATEAYSQCMLPTSLLLEAYRRMVLIRLTEDAIAQDFRDNRIYSFYHSSAGEEATAVGVALALGPDDRVFGNHRSHGHYLAKGGDLYRMLAEIYGKADGCCHGKGGSMHMLYRSVNFMGSTPILGSIVPIATGSAFEQKMTGKKSLTVAFLGDGASEEGAFYESINLAAVKKLPVLYVIEDNLYAVNTPREDRRAAGFSLAKVVTGLGAHFVGVNGNSFAAMHTAVTQVRRGVVEGNPVVMHAVVFRHMAHSGPVTDESVRVVDTKAIRIDTDPIRDIIQLLRSRGIALSALEHTQESIAVDVRAALQRAKDAAYPELAALTEDIYAR